MSATLPSVIDLTDESDDELQLVLTSGQQRVCEFCGRDNQLVRQFLVTCADNVQCQRVLCSGCVCSHAWQSSRDLPSVVALSFLVLGEMMYFCGTKCSERPQRPAILTAALPVDHFHGKPRCVECKGWFTVHPCAVVVGLRGRSPVLSGEHVMLCTEHMRCSSCPESLRFQDGAYVAARIDGDFVCLRCVRYCEQHHTLCDLASHFQPDIVDAHGHPVCPLTCASCLEPKEQLFETNDGEGRFYCAECAHEGRYHFDDRVTLQ